MSDITKKVSEQQTRKTQGSQNNGHTQTKQRVTNTRAEQAHIPKNNLQMQHKTHKTLSSAVGNTRTRNRTCYASNTLKHPPTETIIRHKTTRAIPKGQMKVVFILFGTCILCCLRLGGSAHPLFEHTLTMDCVRCHIARCSASSVLAIPEVCKSLFAVLLLLKCFVAGPPNLFIL